MTPNQLSVIYALVLALVVLEVFYAISSRRSYRRIKDAAKRLEDTSRELERSSANLMGQLHEFQPLIDRYQRRYGLTQAEADEGPPVETQQGEYFSRGPE